MRLSRASLLLLSLLAACGGGDDAATGDDDPGVCPADERTADQVYYGTTTPGYAPLTDGQVLAIGAWTGSPGGGSIFCSGTLIAPEWVLTAAHCGVGAGDYFCFGADAGSPVGCVGVAQATSRPSVSTPGGQTTLDMTIVRLAADATAQVPGVEPIRIMVDSLTGYVGQMAETAGFGETENSSTGDRLFAIETIDDVGSADPGELVVNGMGQRGVCYGDSGGPALVIDASGAPRVAGVLSWGDSSCVDRDRYARADLAVTWIESFTGLTPTPDGAPCGSLDEVGRCSGDRAIYCQAGVVANLDCGDGEACGWSDDDGGFRCISGDDPCGGVDRVGACEGTTAHWCEGGDQKFFDCSCTGQLCVIDSALGGAYCADDPCMGLDYLGECQGTVARWCDNGALREVDCAGNGMTCGYVNDQVGYYCQ